MSATGLKFAPLKSRYVLPGFRLSLGFTIFYLTSLVLIPLLALMIRPFELGLDGVWNVIATPRVLASLRLSFGMALAAAIIDSVFGLIIAWVLVRYRFAGRGIVDALIDLPFALPTAVAGIALSTLYAPSGWLGGILAGYGIKVAYTPLGRVIAMVFISLPFVVRTVEPVLADLGPMLRKPPPAWAPPGCRPSRRVMLPTLYPAWLTGFAMAFARAVGEYGSVIFMAGNLPGKSRNRAAADRHQAGSSSIMPGRRPSPW
jgi:sulfate transport system permease protein